MIYWAKDSVSQDTLGLFSLVKLPVNMFLKKCSVIFGSLYVLGLKSFGDGGQELLLSIAFILFRKAIPPFITFRAEKNVVELNAAQKKWGRKECKYTLSLILHLLFKMTSNFEIIPIFFSSYVPGMYLEFLLADRYIHRNQIHKNTTMISTKRINFRNLCLQIL